MQVCATRLSGKAEFPSCGLASCTLHAPGRTEPALLDLAPPSSRLSAPSLAQMLLLAPRQRCSQGSSRHRALRVPVRWH